ncbi:hypothetical protein T4B_14349 [Trichinella pseudospiralis]|uniref:Uncharacterized protein n=1 Tax=Trichinella pseudospiralis TaxID=6337 RepID=A0A0V1IDR6_TRIPS|nr:hypothetical protein T4B_3999 [Trichinella pseudospiralis]KRZ20720.1 hypothetical protein T4B_14349 [Trichinella pseudospiralis]KRZ24328.1 hypothetical protein T4C_10463 [Trichinella pseudospiralis]KRZ45771.1 hypothetical protein T4C_12915 [Trichinella pseudospiralis]
MNRVTLLNKELLALRMSLSLRESFRMSKKLSLSDAEDVKHNSSHGFGIPPKQNEKVFRRSAEPRATTQGI